MTKLTAAEQSNAQHWPCTARHEAGHAVAAVVVSRELERDYPSFHRVLIRPGISGPSIDTRGRAIDCLGLLEREGSWQPRLYPHDVLRQTEAYMKILWVKCMTLDVIISLGGPFAQARWQGHGSKRSARWDALLGGGCRDDYRIAENTIADLRAMTRRGSLQAFEARTYDLVKREWRMPWARSF